MGHGNGIKWYRHIELPGSGIAAAGACLQVDPARPPGSPDEFYNAATRLAQRAQAIRDVLAQLDSIARNGCVWQGEAADAFRKVLRDAHDSHYDQVPVRYDGYAQALRQYGSALYGHQAAIDGARADVQAALDAYHRATSVTPPEGGPGYAPLRLPSASCDAVIDDCLTAARRFQVAYNDWVDAVTACEHAIERVDDDELHNAHGVHAAVDAIASLSGSFAEWAAVLAVLALPWAPLAVAFLELSTALSVVHLSADVTRKAAWGEHITATDFAIDALGAIPILGPLGKGVKAARAAKAVGAVGKADAGVRVGLHALGEELRAVVPALGKLRQQGIRRVLSHPDLRGMGPTLVRHWDLQDAAAAALQAGHQAATDRQQGLRKSIEKAAFSVVLGPMSPVAVTAFDAAGRAVVKTAAQAAHGAR